MADSPQWSEDSAETQLAAGALRTVRKHKFPAPAGPGPERIERAQ